MEKTFLTACASFGACLLPLPIQADPYIWDNQNNNGIWNDPVNWGTNNNPGYNMVPTAADVAIFRSDSPAGTVTLTNDGFAQKIRQNVSAPARIITIGADETVDRTLTLSGTSTELFDCAAGTADLTLDGTPNGYHARLKLVINGTQTACPVNVSMSLVLNCNVSGTNGFALNAGGSGTGRLVLGGANTYSGPTTVNAGTLLVNGSLAAASAVSVAPRATLGGTGTIAGPVSVAASGTLSPGASVGTLTLNGGLAFSGDLFIEVDKSLSPSNDAVAVTGILTNGGTGTLTVVNLGPALVVGDSFQIFNKPVLNGGGAACGFVRGCNLDQPAGRGWVDRRAARHTSPGVGGPDERLHLDWRRPHRPELGHRRQLDGERGPPAALVEHRRFSRRHQGQYVSS